MSYPTLHWDDVPVSHEVRSALESLHDANVPLDERKGGLVRLLGSGSVIARGIALDVYSMAKADRRHGDQPLVDDAVMDAAARSCALHELVRPPFDPSEAGGHGRRGANHASALHALWFN